MKNEFATKETVERLSVGNVVCSIVRDGEEFDNLVLTHKDYPFKCGISFHAFSSYKPTTTHRIYLEQNEISTILNDNGLSYIQGYSIRDSINYAIKYSELNTIPVPSKVNFRTVKGNRLAKFYDEWFKYINDTEYTLYVEKAKEMNTSIDKNSAYVNTLQKETKNSTVSLHQRTYIIRNKFATIKMADTSNSPNIEVTSYNMTDEQKRKLFIFLDTL